jgi:hypothetical protein
LLAENAELARAFRDMAAEVKRREADAATVGTQIESRLLPAARLLEKKALAIVPPSPALAVAHGHLIAAWGARTESYEAVLEAWKGQDLSAFDTALELRMEGRRMESRHIEAVQHILSPMGLRLVAYPTAAATAE